MIKRLSAVYDLDLLIGVELAQISAQAFGLAGGDRLAVLQGDDFQVARVHLFEQDLDDTATVRPGGRQLVIKQADDIAGMDRNTVKESIVYGDGHLARLDVAEGSRHDLHIARHVNIWVERQQRADALRDGLAWHDAYLLGGAARLGRQQLRLLGSHDDVTVVWQNDNFPVRDPVDSLQQLLRARVHGLAAGDNSLCAQALKDLTQALPRSHHNDTPVSYTHLT